MGYPGFWGFLPGLEGENREIWGIWGDSPDLGRVWETPAQGGVGKAGRILWDREGFGGPEGILQHREGFGRAERILWHWEESWDTLGLGRVWGSWEDSPELGKKLGKLRGCSGTGKDLEKLGMTILEGWGQSGGAQELPAQGDFGILGFWDAQTKRSPAGLEKQKEFIQGVYKKSNYQLKVFIN